MLQRIARKNIVRIVAGALGLAALVFIAGNVGNARPAMAQTNCNVSDDFDDQEREFLRLINNYRAENGLGALTASANLNQASAWMAQDLAEGNTFAHTDSLGRSPAERVEDCDGQPYVGENIAAGTERDTAREAFAAWRASAGHNANMLNESYQQIGIARHYDAGSRYSWYWVTDFSTSNDGTNAVGTTSVASRPPAAPVESTAAEMISPEHGAQLTGDSTTFSWSAVPGASQYYLYFGTSQGGYDLGAGSAGQATSATVGGLTSVSGTLWVRLWTNVNSSWEYNDYSYTLP